MKHLRMPMLKTASLNSLMLLPMLKIVLRKTLAISYFWGMDGWMDLLVGTGVSTALENVQWPKPFLTPAKPLRSGWLIQRIDSSTATTTGATLPYLQYFDSRSRQTAVGPGVKGSCGKVQRKKNFCLIGDCSCTWREPDK